MTTSFDKSCLTIEIAGWSWSDLSRVVGYENGIGRSKEIQNVDVLLRYKSDSTDYRYARRIIEAAYRNPRFPSVHLFLELDNFLDRARVLLGYHPTAIKSLLFLRAPCYDDSKFKRDFLAYQIALLPDLRDLTYLSGSLQSRRLLLEILAYSATIDTFRLESLNVVTCLQKTDLSERHRSANIQTASFFKGMSQFLTSPNGSKLKRLSLGLVGPVTAEEHLLFSNLYINKSIEHFTCFFVGSVVEERCNTIGRLLKHNQSMKHVRLACDNFRGEFGFALADGLGQNTSMEHLAMHFFPRNSIQDCLMEITSGPLVITERARKHPADVSVITKSLIQRNLPLKTLLLTSWSLSDESVLGLVNLIGSPQLGLEKLQVVSSFSGKMVAPLLNELTKVNKSLMSVQIKQVDAEDLYLLESLQSMLQRVEPNIKELKISCSPSCLLSWKQHRKIASKWKCIQPKLLASAKNNGSIEKLHVEVDFQEHFLSLLDESSLDENDESLQEEGEVTADNVNGEEYVVSTFDYAQRHAIVIGLLNLRYGGNNSNKYSRNDKPDSQWDIKGVRLLQELEALGKRNIRANRIALEFIHGSATLAELPFALSRILSRDDTEMASIVALSHVQRLLNHFTAEIREHHWAKSCKKIS